MGALVELFLEMQFCWLSLVLAGQAGWSACHG
jgi:hypothetical protein